MRIIVKPYMIDIDRSTRPKLDRCLITHRIILIAFGNVMRQRLTNA